MISSFRLSGVPIVFWNKEDPPNFHLFVETAKEADFVFTTAEEMIPKYRQILGHKRVALMPFFVQPLIHYPRVGGDFSGQVSFGGSFLPGKYPERTQQMEAILGAALKFKFDIFDRQKGRGKSPWPLKYRSHLAGHLPYRQLLEAQKRYKVALNVNSVAGSVTMCSRRVFELAASGVPILSSVSPAVSNIFGDAVFQTDCVEEAQQILQQIFGTYSALKNRSDGLVSLMLSSHTSEIRLG